MFEASLGVPQTFFRYSLGIAQALLSHSLAVFLRVSLGMAFPYISFRYPPIEVHTFVETMLSKLSSFKRASRSLAKTGF